MRKQRPSPEQGYKILIVDDDEDVRSVLRQILEKDHSVTEAADAATALRAVDLADPDVVLLDLDLGPGPDGFWVLERLREFDSELPVVILSVSQDTNTVVQAMKAGASHYIAKTPRYDELAERLHLAVKDRRRALKLQLHRFSVVDFLGQGPLIEEVCELAQKAAVTDISVLILGETGTGKSLLAKYIHQAGPRRQGPFKDVNVAALPSSLLDSELFGHERGAFTGADRRHRGLFELALGGTILLDEIGDLPRECQVKLLQAVEERRFRRLGGEKDLQLQIRILAATHQDLNTLMNSDTFRRDLYYRLAGLEIWIPPLREHPESIPSLVRNFLGDGVAVTDSALGLLAQQPWPGNVRELQQILRRSTLFTDGELVDSGSVQRALRPAVGANTQGIADELWFYRPYAEASTQLKEHFQREYLKRLLRRCRGNISHAATESGISRSHLHTLIKRYGLSSRNGIDVD